MVRFWGSRYSSQAVLSLLKTPEKGRERPSAQEKQHGDSIDPLLGLARAAARGDRSAQRTLLVSVGPALLGVVRGVLGSAHPDVEDVLQEAMAAVHDALPNFRGECWTIHYARRIAVQVAMNARRRAGYRAQYTPSTPPEALIDLARDERSPADMQAAAERREALRRLLDELPEPQAEALALHVVLGYSVDETSAITQVPRDTVRSRLRAALAALRHKVRRDEVWLELLGGGQ